MSNPVDSQWMQRCLALARRGQGRVHPNPMVGAVVLDAQGQFAGEGYHTQYGEAHAEVMALANAGEKARGGTLYVNLEPCSHTGKTPPCADAVIAAGVARVVVGSGDPNPKVNGQGVERLRSAGISLTENVLAEDCRQLNEAFYHAVVLQKPFVLLKQAMTIDGKVATRTGESQWITCPEARQFVHQLRAESDGLLTTASTLIADQARLSVRGVPLLGEPPMRIVLDRTLKTPLAKIQRFLAVEGAGPVCWVIAPRFAEDSRLNVIRDAGGYVLPVAEIGQGFDLAELMTKLYQLHRVTQVMVEAGGRLAGSLIEAGLVQKLWLAYGGLLMGDPFATSAFDGPPLMTLKQASRWRFDQTYQWGQTVMMSAYPHREISAQF